jgi:hypothetical protein
MMDANNAYQTVVLIRHGTPDTTESSIAGFSQAQLDEQMAFIEAELKDCALCRRTRVSNNVLIGLFPTADSAFGVACSVQQACRDRGHDSAPVDVRMLLDRLAGNFVDNAASPRSVKCTTGGSVDETGTTRADPCHQYHQRAPRRTTSCQVPAVRTGCSGCRRRRTTLSGNLQ